MSERDAGQTPDMDSNALIGSTLGGFRLTSLLGVGGMAEVYRGYDVQLQRDVAVKVLPHHVARDPRYVARFRNEAQRIAALHHPNVVPIFHFGEERGLLYLVMPILKESLRDRMTREGTLDPLDAIFLAVEIALALDAAHSQGVVHRDVKPENILLNEDGQPLLSDFGIAREVEALRDPTASRTLATSGMPIGTPAYMAPELLRGSVADHRVDVYSLGIVLYEMITGYLPHDGVTAFDVAAKVLTEAPLPPAYYNPAIWPELEAVVLGAIASDPDQRYSDMSSMVEALRHAALARGTSTSIGLTAPPLAGRPGSTRLSHPVPASALRGGDLLPVRDAVPEVRPDRRDFARVIATRWGDTSKPGWRRRVLLMAAAAVVLAMALVASGLGGVLYAFHMIGSVNTVQGPSTATAIATVMPTQVLDASPSVMVEKTPKIAPTQTSGPVPSATATPLLTPTMVVSASPLKFQPTQNPNNCIATQTLTNISAVDATWSWSNSPSLASGWQYYSGTTWQDFKASLTMTTPPHSSVYVSIKTALTDPSCAKYSTVATITVTDGKGVQFNVTY